MMGISFYLSLDLALKRWMVEIITCRIRITKQQQ